MVLTRRQRKELCNLRSPILQMANHKVPIETAFQQFCNDKGKDAMEFEEFQFWYYRFYNGDHDLNYDRFLAPNNRGLLDLPEKVFNKIALKLNQEDLIAVKQVTPSLRRASQTVPIRFSLILVQFHKNRIRIERVPFDDHMGIDHTFKNVKGGCETTINEGGFFVKEKSSAPEKSFAKEALKHFKFLLNHQNLEVDKLKILFDDVEEEWVNEHINLLLKAFRTFDYNIKATDLQVNTPKWSVLGSIVPYLAPEALNKLTVNCRSPRGNPEFFDKFMEMEHWRNLKQLVVPMCSLILEVDQLSHLDYFKIRNYASMKFLKHIRNVLLPRESFLGCHVGFSLDDNVVRHIFGVNWTDTRNGYYYYVKCQNIEIRRLRHAHPTAGRFHFR